jgi:adenylosuccinate lyase
MLARTHGQPATPTTLGKEILVFSYRLTRQLKRLESVEFLGKLNGATGTFAAHKIAAPKTDWVNFSRTFIEETLHLTYNPITTQIESHDAQAELYEAMSHICYILHNLCTDFWEYISRGVFIQIKKAEEVGSSAMPHKINPIKFENAEANLEISSSLLNTLAQTLVQSRMQRDLSDSSMQRNVGVAFGYSLLAITSIIDGLSRLDVSKEHLSTELNANWEVITEAINSTLRYEIVSNDLNIENPYEKLKDLTRGNRVSKDTLREFISSLEISTEAKERLLALSPEKYVGLAGEIVDEYYRNLVSQGAGAGRGRAEVAECAVDDGAGGAGAGAGAGDAGGDVL